MGFYALSDTACTLSGGSTYGSETQFSRFSDLTAAGRVHSGGLWQRKHEHWQFVSTDTDTHDGQCAGAYPDDG